MKETHETMSISKKRLKEDLAFYEQCDVMWPKLNSNCVGLAWEDKTFNCCMWRLKGDDVERQMWKGFEMKLTRWNCHIPKRLLVMELQIVPPKLSLTHHYHWNRFLFCGINYHVVYYHVGLSTIHTFNHLNINTIDK
jgi:hypothetical protein